MCCHLLYVVVSNHRCTIVFMSQEKAAQEKAAQEKAAQAKAAQEKAAQENSASITAAQQNSTADSKHMKSRAALKVHVFGHKQLQNMTHVCWKIIYTASKNLELQFVLCVIHPRRTKLRYQSAQKTRLLLLTTTLLMIKITPVLR